jgi:hypothetical protein
VIAPTLAEAVRLLGINDLIAATVLVETARAEAAEAAEAAARAAAITAEATARSDEDITLGAAIAAEISRAEAAEAALAASIAGLPGTPTAGTRAGSLTTDGTGSFSITFAPAFATGVAWATVPADGSVVGVSTSVLSTTTWIGSLSDGGGIALTGHTCNWFAIGF